MHSIRSKARHAAWKGQEKGVNLNFFAYSRSRTPSKLDEEADGGQVMERIHSENCAIPDIERQRVERNAASNEQYGMTPHANTMPDSSPTAQEFHAEPEPVEVEEKKSSDVAGVTGSQPEPVKARRRQKIPLLGRMLSKKSTTNKDETDQGEKSSGSTKKKGPKLSIGQQLKATIFGSWVNVLLIAVPVGIALKFAHVNSTVVFVVNFIAIVPLAGLLSYATEEIALRVGETLGGLLNATFGNAVELIISIIALTKNEIIIVQTSLIGSILSNLLLVLGMCFFFGGINRLEQHFNVTVAQTAASLLALAVGTLIIPTVFNDWSSAGGRGVAQISRGASVILLLVYASYLIFQLKSHADMYNEPSEKVAKRSQTKKIPAGEANRGIAGIGVMGAANAGVQVNQEYLENPPDKEQPQLSMTGALITLAVATVLVAICAEFMVSGISALTKSSGISTEFVGLILLPIVGNAAEHATAVTVAVKDKMDLAIGVAVGSSMQIALLVIPFTVILGWIMGKNSMTLKFDGFQIAVLFVTVLLVNYLIQDGKSHWLEGVLLMATYTIIAVAAIYYPDDPNLLEG